MHRFLFVFSFFISILISGQEYLNKNEKFDLITFQYLDSLTTTDQVSLEEYLKFSKPFSKWDIRPIKDEKIWSLDSIRTSSEIANFFWGGFSQHFELTAKEAGAKPNQFLNSVYIEKNANIDFLNQNIDKFKMLSSEVKKGNNKIFLNQISLHRIDNLFKENNKYWTYIISPKSPFPISDKINIERKSKFSKEQERILKQMQDLSVYAIVKTDKGVFFLKDGFTDNSHGYYYSFTKTMEQNNHLFEISDFTKINDEFYHYIAN